MKRVLLWLGGGIVVLIGVILLTGLVLPREHKVQSCLTLTAPAESVWAVMRDIGATPTWWHDMERAERTDSAGAERWTESAGGFTMTVRVEEVTPGHRFDTTIEPPPDAVFGGVWRHEVSAAEGGGSVACLSEDGWVSNPAFRAIGYLMGQRKTIDSYLTALSARFGGGARPEHRN